MAERRQPRLSTVLLGFVLGVALGLVLCFTVFRFDFHGFEIGGTAVVYVFGAEFFSIGGIFANLTPIAVSVVVCVVTGIAGALISFR